MIYNYQFASKAFSLALDYINDNTIENKNIYIWIIIGTINTERTSLEQELFLSHYEKELKNQTLTFTNANNRKDLITGLHILNNTPSLAFFTSHKSYLFELLSHILDSVAVHEIITSIYDYKIDNEIIEDFKNWCLNNTIYYIGYNSTVFGFTDNFFLNVFINTELNSTDYNNDNEKIVQLFTLGRYLLTLICEYIGNALKQYLYFSSNFEVSDYNNKKGRNTIETLIFGKPITELTLSMILVLVQKQNWDGLMIIQNALKDIGKKAIRENNAINAFLSECQLTFEDIVPLLETHNNFSSTMKIPTLYIRRNQSKEISITIRNKSIEDDSNDSQDDVSESENDSDY